MTIAVPKTCTMPPVSKTRRISPQEWIQDYFSPIVGILSCDDTEILCRKNNLTMVELLQPFSKLLADVTLKDPDGVNHPVANLNILFQDYRRDPSRLVNSKLMYDTVAEITEEPFVTKTFNRNENVLEAPGFTPWFDAYMKLYLQSIPAMEHEFVRHHLGVIFAVAANNQNPVETLRTLSQLQHKQQHENRAATYPQYISANVLEYFVLVHDVCETEESNAHEIFTQIQQAFGSSFCHLLQINSRTQHQLKSPGEVIVPAGGNPGVADNWFLGSGHRFCNVEMRLFNNTSTTPTTLTPVLPTKSETSNHASPPKAEDLDHPLAVLSSDDKPESPLASGPVPKLTKAEYTNVALHLTPNDIDRIRIFVREFCIRGLIPYVERQMRLFNEIVTNRKSRSLFSGAKRWFGQAKPGTASGTSVIYGKEAPELQIRKLGDLFFMMKLYKQAYNCYYTAKKDFQSDEAWNYYAGAAEMSALSQFMQSDTTKKYPSHYMEDSISKYLQVCQLPEFAVRATLFDAICLKFNGMFHESAASYIRITNDTKDLRSALLLEQASYCYLLANPALIRKYAFHIILAGSRFSKCGQKRHSSRAYKQGLLIYKGRGWSLSEDHILYNLGHQSLLLKEHSVAALLFNDLLEMTSPSLNPLQQMCHLREFFIVHHLREKDDKKDEKITIPKIHSQKIILDLTGQTLPYEQLVDTNIGSSWQSLERIVVEEIRGGEMAPPATKTCQTIFGPSSNNTVKPVAMGGERVRLLLPIENPFQTPFLMKKIQLLWKFNKGDETFSNDASTSDAEGDFVKVETVDSLTIDKNGRAILDLSLVVNGSEGQLTILGLTYGIRALFPQSEATDYTIRGKQYFEVKGPRLNLTKEHKTSVSYANDYRLQLNLSPPMPRLEVKWSGLPETLHQGEVKRVSLELVNQGGSDLCHLHLVHHQPGTISLQGGKGPRGKTLFPFPVITDSSLKKVAENGMAKDVPIDILPVDLPSKKIDIGQSVSVNCFLRGPDQLGSHSLNLYFYYESPLAPGSRQIQFRLLKSDFVIKVIPSVSVVASRCRPCLHDNNLAQTILVAVSNNMTTQSSQIAISQLTLLSHTSVIKQILSENDCGNFVQRGESVVFGVQTCADQNTPSGIQISSVRTQGGKHFGLEETPYLEFVKPAFTFASRKKEPLLARDVVAVTWRAGGASSSTTGLVYVPLKDDPNPVKEFDAPDAGATDGVSTSDSLDLSLPTPKRGCHLDVNIAKHFKHDFGDGLPMYVSFELSALNTSSGPGRLHLKADKDWRSIEGAPCRYLGCTLMTTSLQPGTKKSFQFRLLITSPGIYNCQGLRFQFSSPEDERPDEDELIPLEVAFVVAQEKQ